MDTIVAGLSKSLTPMRSMRDGELHAAEKPHVADVAIEKVVTSEEHQEANVTTDWAGLLDAEPPPTALRNFLSDAARALAPDELVHYAGGRLIAPDTLLSAADRQFLERHKGLGNSQKAEVAWLEKRHQETGNGGYLYEEVDVRDFISKQNSSRAARAARGTS